MALRNSPGSYGLLTRALHWLTALLVLTALPFGAYIARMEVTLDSLKYFGWHKSAGLVVLALVALRIEPPVTDEHLTELIFDAEGHPVVGEPIRESA